MPHMEDRPLGVLPRQPPPSSGPARPELPVSAPSPLDTHEALGQGRTPCGPDSGFVQETPRKLPAGIPRAGLLDGHPSQALKLMVKFREE